jgi:putative ATP-dependent endonuclease of the OLD family
MEMKLTEVILTNFRAYRGEIRIPTGNLTAFIGKNDVGKSSVLEALDIFFNEDALKLDKEDLNKECGSEEVRIGCVFDDLPLELVLDAEARTSLDDEYMLNAEGKLEIHKVYDCRKAKLTADIIAVANHPTAEGVADLLQLKNTELKKRMAALSVPHDGVNQAINASIRRALWNSVPDLHRKRREIPLTKLVEDRKDLWTSIQRVLPHYALFKADRPSRDNDEEVQDPMSVAVRSAISEVQEELTRVQQRVQQKATELAGRTLEKLREINPELATELVPRFSAEPKWESFKLTLATDNGIPLNKRGSGTRRLVLLSFFRADAEFGRSSGSLIYAVEEPETSQHPRNQEVLVSAFMELASNGTQVILTTHNPCLAGLLPKDSIRFVSRSIGTVEVSHSSDDVYDRVAAELGVLPDNRLRLLVFVEGINDVNFLRNVSKVLHAARPEIPDLTSDSRVATIPVGGSSLSEWVKERYLRELHKPELHLYDRDSSARYQADVDRINADRLRTGSFAALTTKLEMENYLHPDAIRRVLNVDVNFGDDDDVPQLVAAAIHNSAPDRGEPWDELDQMKKKDKERRAKKHLNERVAAAMTLEEFRNRDQDRELERWFERMGDIINGQQTTRVTLTLGETLVPVN